MSVIKRIHDGTSGNPLTMHKLTALGIAEGNAIRVQRTLSHLGFLDESHELTELARRVRKASSEEYPVVLAEILRAAYPHVFEIIPDPATASATSLSNAFRLYDPGGQQGNMIRLFTALCEEAGLVSTRLPAGTTKKGRPQTDRKATPEQKSKSREQGGQRATAPRLLSGKEPPPAHDTGLDLLLAKFPEFDPKWEGEIQAKWFDAFGRLHEQLKER